MSKKIIKKKSLATGVARYPNFCTEIKQLMAGMGVKEYSTESVNQLNDLLINFIKNLTKAAIKNASKTKLDAPAILKAHSYDSAKHDHAQYIIQSEELIGKTRLDVSGTKMSMKNLNKLV
ncbi:uncharacterized protein LOC119667251 [Teleopsis dalmanni]|uniref:uncharacterized protein LOC119667251 n=1 Tax=Teleopsis dalmanni TaxID=139649 RepID=UPI0018CF9EE5|nr:uncharacterized protein LOC119667251 [Teleopsis dalmanni]